MWNYLKAFFTNGSFRKKFWTIAGLLFGIYVIYCFFAVSNAGGFGTISVIAALFWKKKRKAIKEKLNEIITVPYWGEIFGVKKCFRLLAEDRFKPYIAKDGHKSKSLKVSASGRWFCMSGRYYPTYLVYDYIPSTGELTMINGEKIILEHKLRGKEDISELMEFLNADRRFEINDGIRSRVQKKDLALAFLRAWGDDMTGLATADWELLRFNWEKELTDIEINSLERSDINKNRQLLQKTTTAREALLSRVLLAKEIEIIASAIKERKINDLKGWFDVASYDDDSYISNGVRLLRELGYPRNKAGVDFLFDCIKDIQKPYFEDAIEALSLFPRDELIELIEMHVTKAHEEGDVLFGAGLIYLSGKINYEISLSRNKKLEGEPQLFTIHG